METQSDNHQTTVIDNSTEATNITDIAQIQDECNTAATTHHPQDSQQHHDNTVALPFLPIQYPKRMMGAPTHHVNMNMT